MQISAIAKVASVVSEKPGVARQIKPPVSLSPGTIQNSGALTSAGASTQGSPAATHSENLASIVPVPPLAAQYSTTVAGKSYPLSVDEAGGTYVASVPNPPGASATGSSPQSAEDNLDMKLDTLA
jgi:hypothetical protein